MKVLTLAEFGETNFLKCLEEFRDQNFSGDIRNKDWFSRLPEIYKTRFKEWFFLVNKTELIAFATIQEFYPKCYRLLTRTYYNPKYRRTHLHYNTSEKTPAIYLLEAQIAYLTDFDTIFISMQDLKRRNALIRLMKKINAKWQLHPEMVKTCGEDSSNCWQSVIYLGKDLELPGINISEWNIMNDKRLQ
jgi:hypothetical protein